MTLTLLKTSPSAYQARPYQTEAHEAVREAWAEGVEGPMLVMATGTGKTATALGLVVSDFLERGKRVVWLAHREELLTQARDSLVQFWPHHTHRVGIVQAERDNPDADLVCASVATLAASPHRVQSILRRGPVDLVVLDEAHHDTSPTHRAAIEALAAPKRLGLTATPDREDGADLSAHWEIVFSYGIVDAIRGGFLVPPLAVVERLPDLDLSKVSGRRDYDDGELGAELLRAGVVEHTVAMMSKVHLAQRLPDRDTNARLAAEGRPTLVFTATVEQAERTAEALRDAGWRARHISGLTPKLERRRLISAFRRGQIDVLCNAAVLTEGTDLPRASCVVLARPTRSWSLFVQMVGRGLRLYEGKVDCLVLDLAGATDAHSLVSAPVLIGGSRCPKSDNGIHTLIPRENPQEGADCEHCGRKVACGVLLGPHNYNSDHHCEACGKPQCLDSPDAAHAWVPQAEHKRMCLHCGAEVPDPLAGMVGKGSRKETVAADWVRLDGLAPETFVVDIGDHGLLFVKRQRPGWMPVWLRKGGRKPRPLHSSPIPTELVRGYADDLVRRAAKVAAKAAQWKDGRPSSRARSRYFNETGNWPDRSMTAGDVQRALTVARAKARAIKTGIAREV